MVAQVHPQSWAVVSRNTSRDDESEWTCVHDIQEFPVHEGPATEDAQQPGPSKESPQPSGSGTAPAAAAREDPVSYYMLSSNQAATPRFEVLLDTTGRSDWADLAAPDNQSAESSPAVDGENQHRPDGADADADVDHRQRAIMLGLNILIQRNAASVYSDLRSLGGAAPSGGDGREEEGDGDEEDEEDDVGLFPRLYRRRGTRGRAGQLPLLAARPRDRIERQNLLLG